MATRLELPIDPGHDRIPGPLAPGGRTSATHPPRGRVSAAGKFLYTGGRKLFLRGVTYGTFREGDDGCAFPEPGVVSRDFSRMVSVGINTVRTYTVPPGWLRDMAHGHGLALLVGLPWEQHTDVLADRRRTRSIIRRIRNGVAECAGHPAVLGYTVGNEIPASIVRWRGRARVERFIHTLYDAAKSTDPRALVTYANFPTTEYLRLPFLDFHAFNVFLESPERLDAYVARLQNLSGDRPLVLTELGLDSRSAGVAAQAASVSAQVRTAFAAGCAGAFVFSWTDEWHRGGEAVTGWDFGMVDRDRGAKPALLATKRAFEAVPVALTEDAPAVSVVVCVFNAEARIRECLEGVVALDYPRFEVIVVDDGSTDSTARIAAEFDVRLIRTENRGLSRARNTGIEAARGDIVAFLDGDAWPDPHWLRYLAHTFATADFVGAGGPNLQPPGRGWFAESVAAAPGGPIHVLSSDRVAEHIPGCNMAFRRRALLEVGGFDPRFRVAGDDVDLCWRLQHAGGRLGFHAGALVWHHQRDSVRAFWKQQRGYGRAEALLEAKWPEKYNSVGHVTWGGRVYGRGVPLLFGRARVYHGTWGAEPFQPLQPQAPGFLASLASTPEWNLVIALLAVLSLGSLLWRPLLLALPLLGLATGVVMVQALRHARAASRRRRGSGRLDQARFAAMTFLLHMLQPLARLVGRVSHGLTPWRLHRGSGAALPVPRRKTVWSEDWRSAGTRLAALEETVRRSGARVSRGGAYDAWDLEVAGGALGRARLRMAVEEHGEGRQLVRFGLRPRVVWPGTVLAAVVSGLGAWAALDGALWTAALLGTAAVLVVVRTGLEAATAMAAALHGIGGHPE